MEFESSSLQEWARDKPLSILQLDPADRAVLRIAGNVIFFFFFNLYKTMFRMKRFSVFMRHAIQLVH